MNEIFDELNNADRAELEVDEPRPVQFVAISIDDSEVF